MYVKVNDLPDIVRSKLNDVKYGRVDIEVQAREKVSPASGSGDGYQSFCIIINLSNNDVKHLTGSWGGANMFNPGNQVDLDTKSYDIPDGFVVITGSVGGSKPTYASISMNPNNIAKFLPEKTGLTERQATILYTYKGLNPRGRKDYWDRWDSDMKRAKPSEDELNELATMGLLKRSKNGATQITTDGRNAFENCDIKVKTY